MYNNNGFLFGFIDNAIVAIFALIGIELEQYYQGMGAYGALYGAMIGHTISDMVAGYMDFGARVALNMGLGCIAVIFIVKIYLSFV
tara:strand:- start:2268 stop:2525 length:258 start_codon:yes stop_codon:yes gene_type:complete